MLIASDGHSLVRQQSSWHPLPQCANGGTKWHVWLIMFLTKSKMKNFIKWQQLRWSLLNIIKNQKLITHINMKRYNKQKLEQKCHLTTWNVNLSQAAHSLAITEIAVVFAFASCWPGIRANWLGAGEVWAYT